VVAAVVAAVRAWLRPRLRPALRCAVLTLAMRAAVRPCVLFARLPRSACGAGHGRCVGRSVGRCVGRSVGRSQVAVQREKDAAAKAEERRLRLDVARKAKADRAMSRAGARARLAAATSAGGAAGLSALGRASLEDLAASSDSDAEAAAAEAEADAAAAAAAAGGYGRTSGPFLVSCAFCFGPDYAADVAGVSLEALTADRRVAGAGVEPTNPSPPSGACWVELLRDGVGPLLPRPVVLATYADGRTRESAWAHERCARFSPEVYLDEKGECCVPCVTWAGRAVPGREG
jgi:hypothetical protein